MTAFEYRAMQPDGQMAEGELEADGRPEAFRQMEAKGLRPISLFERGGKTSTPDPHLGISYILALLAEGFFGLGLFLPAVNLNPWLPGFNVFMLSFLGTGLLGFGSMRHFAACVLGAAANVLMITSFSRILRGRRVAPYVTAATVALTFATAGALCHLTETSLDKTVSFGFFAWAGCAALLMVASLNQSWPWSLLAMMGIPSRNE